MHSIELKLFVAALEFLEGKAKPFHEQAAMYRKQIKELEVDYNAAVQYAAEYDVKADRIKRAIGKALNSDTTLGIFEYRGDIVVVRTLDSSDVALFIHYKGDGTVYRVELKQLKEEE